MKLICVSCILLSVLVGCAKNEASCSDETATSVARSLIASSLAEKIETEVKGTKKDVDTSAINALVAQFKISLGDIRTSKKDPNSSKVFCSATIGVQFSEAVIQDADKVRKSISYKPSTEFVRDSGLKFEAYKLIGDFEYSVQPTDDGKKVFAELQGNQKPLLIAAEIASSALLKTVVESAEALKASERDAAQAKIQQAEIQKQQSETEQRQAEEIQKTLRAKNASLQLEEAQLAITQANAKINVAWNAISKIEREAMLPEQRVWLKRRELDCKTKGVAEQATDLTAQETVRLLCEVEMTQKRTDYLDLKLLKTS
ncbi:lysozyme inhibitor LprI family protein [Polaromonas naphthalenivorans]|uniref:Lysozyme inhibitor LprI N-terminal domain-containing protein n=1 Tax=Polaromonas naphthalenivorans (strain CJ2) TaxID=365044 RepID=A1VWP1_POLNA|nr:hypothetical protein [Polaromonas naphthalenivorans]ABM40069.1 conserved hypothetical protein [Polaromonas naphthalenivorans CJ2]